MRAAGADRVLRRPTEADAVFLLENGARMDRETFHALYLRTPEGFKAELVGGLVHVSSPVSLRHARPHMRLATWLYLYGDETPGVDGGDNVTTFLGRDEVQPDAALFIPARLGGQARVDRNGYIHGPPELVAEVAHSSASIDLGTKKAQYEGAGVREYLVILVNEKRAVWHGLRGGRFEELAPGDGGLVRSEAFPGLWIDPVAYFAPGLKRAFAALRQGLASPEHAAFVADLTARRKTTGPSKKPRKKK